MAAWKRRSLPAVHLRWWHDILGQPKAVSATRAVRVSGPRTNQIATQRQEQTCNWSLLTFDQQPTLFHRPETEADVLSPLLNVVSLTGPKSVSAIGVVGAESESQIRSGTCQHHGVMKLQKTAANVLPRKVSFSILVPSFPKFATVSFFVPALTFQHVFLLRCL